MKTTTVILYLMSLLLSIPAAYAELKIDFTQAAGLVEAGYEGYFASHEVPATFTAQSYSTFGTTITVRPTWAANATAAAMQMIDRGGDDGTDAPDLLRDWIGTDNRQPGNPMTLTISGLPAGTYTWLSYHHDPHDQTGPFDVTVIDALGSAATMNIDISSTVNDGIVALANVTTFTTQIVSDGSDVSLTFRAKLNTPVAVAFFVMNALVLEAQNPCYNSPPTIRGPNALSVFIGEPVVIDVTVADDGMPHIEGCDPDQPETGTSYGLQYQWLQQSGPAPVAIEPISADVEDPNVVFPLVGTYELLLQVSDGPVGSSSADGKVTEFLITVEALEPLKGDIDRNEIVDFLDLWILAEQWLDTPACLEDAHCADLDDSGSVTADDFALLALNWLAGRTRVVINEFVASNSQSLIDGDGNASDWIELHNPDTQPVSLGGWYLTDDKNNLKKWRFPPATVLPAEGYLVVFASDQPTDNYIDKKGYLHTNFAIDKEGEYLALVGPSGAIMHQFAPFFPPQERDISYGMWYTTVRYFAVPTPGQANEQAFPGFTGKTSHSHFRGFYDEPFSLRIYCDTPGAFIRYTLDGSEPTEQYGMIYDPNTPLPVTTTTHVRSVAFKPGWKPGGVTTHTYIFVDDVARQAANPLGWPSDWGYDSDLDNNDGARNGTVPADYEMDPRVVDNTLPGYSIRDALLDVPTVSISMHPDDFISDAAGIYANPRSRWERKCSVEYILPDGTEGFQHDCKIEIHGNASRRPYRMQKHSFRLTFTSLYGPPKLSYPLFPESGVEEFNQLVLRAGFTDSWGLVSWTESRYRPNDSQYIRDVWMKESLRDMGQPSTYGNFVHVYVNGLYFGLYNLTERFADDFLADHLGGQAEDWEINEDFSTTGSRWRAMMSIDPSTLAGYSQIQDYLDIENFADYMLLHFYADAEDWPHHNGYAAANAVSGDGKFRFFVWDQEIVLDYHGRAAARIDSTGGAGDVFQKMRTSEEFRLLFADRVQKHCFNDGALSKSISQARYLSTANWIDKAIVAESARWGDTQMSTPYGNTIRQPSPLTDINHNLYPPVPHGPDFYFTREDSWLVERDNVINNYIPAIHNAANSYALINVLRAENLYPAIEPPELSPHGGWDINGFTLGMTRPATVYYTLDGADPRLPGGAVNAAHAAVYSGGTISVTTTTQVKARAKSGSTWSALTEAVFAVGPVAENLRITEMMYHPQDTNNPDDPNTEFIELQNIVAVPININLVRFTNGIDFTFPSIELGPDEYVLVVKDIDAFEAKYGAGLNIAGQYTGNLRNGGERVELQDAAGTTIHNFRYQDGWYDITDGLGFSLTVKDPASADPNNWGDKSVWRPSAVLGGSPGTDDTGQIPELGDVVINELLAHSHAEASDWIELYNTTYHAINIGGWFLSDDESDLKKYEMPGGTFISPGGYIVFAEGLHFGNRSDPGCHVPFALSENGETLYLHSGQDGDLTGYSEQESFDASETDVAFGRYQKSTGSYNFVAMSVNTPGSANTYPKVGPIVISEIMYHPDSPADAEYVELLNISGTEVTLYDYATAQPWRFTDDPDDPGIKYLLPSDPPVTVASGEHILLVKDLAIFNSRYTAPGGTQIFVWGAGRLDNGGEKVQISMPGDVNSQGVRQYIRVDRVTYSDGSHHDDSAGGVDPWPVGADGLGSSLTRLFSHYYGNDPNNWTAALPSPGE